MNLNKIVVYDFETDSADQNTCEPVQLGAIIINPRTLEFIPDSEFNSMMRPTDMVKDGSHEEYVKEHLNTIQWHAEQRKCSVDEVVQSWLDAPDQKDVFLNFQEYLLRYHKKTSRKSKFSAPIKAGYNIIRFDNIIMRRLCERYDAIDKGGDMKLFHMRDQIDAMMFCFNWFEDMEEPTSYSMDYLRPYFGMSDEGAHDALQDVKDTGELIIRFMRLHRKYAEKVRFKGAFK